MKKNYFVSVRNKLDLEHQRLIRQQVEGVARVHTALIDLNARLNMSDELLMDKIEEFREEMKRKRELDRMKHEDALQRIDDEAEARKLKLREKKLKLEAMKAETDQIITKTTRIKTEGRMLWLINNKKEKKF